MEREELIGMFVEEVWDAVCRLRVGSGLKTHEVVRALRQVIVLVNLELTTEMEDRNHE